MEELEVKTEEVADERVVVGAGLEKLRRRRGKDVLGLRLTDRDYRIFGFLLDQKFASLEQLYFRYFDTRKTLSDPLPNNLYVTRQRLTVLRRHGFITTTRVYSEGKSLYLLSSLGFQAFQGKFPHEAYAKPVTSVDFRSYEHDTRVNDCRIAIERTGKVIRWISERKLKMEGFESQQSYQELPDDIVPDGIIVSSKGERIAFEIETTPRKKRRYEDKRYSFESVMRGERSLLHRVIWVGYTDRIFSDLKEVCKDRKNFTVEPYSYFLSKLRPSPQLTATKSEGVKIL